MLALWLLAAEFDATDTAGDLTVWLVLVATILTVGGALLALGRRIITGPITQEVVGMREQIEKVTEQVTELAHIVAQLVTDVAVIKDRQKRISKHFNPDDE